MSPNILEEDKTATESMIQQKAAQLIVHIIYNCFAS